MCLSFESKEKNILIKINLTYWTKTDFLNGLLLCIYFEVE